MLMYEKKDFIGRVPEIEIDKRTFVTDHLRAAASMKDWCGYVTAAIINMFMLTARQLCSLSSLSFVKVDAKKWKKCPLHNLKQIPFILISCKCVVPIFNVGWFNLLKYVVMISPWMLPFEIFLSSEICIIKDIKKSNGMAHFQNWRIMYYNTP